MQFLNIWNIDADDKAVAELKQSLPHCEIVTDSTYVEILDHQ